MVPVPTPEIVETPAPTLFDKLPNEETTAPVTDTIVPEQETAPADKVENVADKKEVVDEKKDKAEDPFGSTFFQQPNVPTVQYPSLVKEEKSGEYTVLTPTPHVAPAKATPAAIQPGIVVTDDGETDYDDDQKFSNLVNRPAWQTAIQDSRIVDVQTPSMQKTVQPEYTAQSVFFGLMGGANAD